MRIRRFPAFTRCPLLMALTAILSLPLACGGSGLVPDADVLSDVGHSGPWFADSVAETATDDPFAAARVLCVDTINTYREKEGLPPYERWVDQESCADGEARSDGETGQGHGAFGSCGERAQNECPGWPGPPESMIEDCLAMMYAEGPGEDFSKHGHYINMTSTSYTKVACGFYVTDGGAVWSVQDFR